MKKKNHVVQSSLGSGKKSRYYYYIVCNIDIEKEDHPYYFIRRFNKPLSIKTPQIGYSSIQDSWCEGWVKYPTAPKNFTKITKKQALTLIRKTYPNFPDHDLPN